MSHSSLPPLLKKLGIPLPIFLAPMAGPATPELVAAVSRAGGLGSLAGAYSPAQSIAESAHKTRQLTDRPFGINLFAPTAEPEIAEDTWQKAVQATAGFRKNLGLPTPILQKPFAENFDEQFAAILAAKPAVFSFVFGILDKKYLAACKNAGIFTLGTATHCDEALQLQEQGVDAIIAQGVEAGGHRGLFSAEQEDRRLGTLPLLQSLQGKLSVPVIAAGGIMNGRGIAAACALGAQAVQLGTAFLACDEAATSQAYRRSLLNSAGKTTRLTRAFSGRWARSLDNDFVLAMEHLTDSILPFPAQNVFTRDMRSRSAELDLPDFLSLWAGQGVDLIRSGKAEELVHTLYREFTDELRELRQAWG